MEHTLGHSNAARQSCNEIPSIVGDTPHLPVVPGMCPICGVWTYFSMNGGSLRESLVCASCFSTSRYRRLALGVLQAIEELTGIQAPSLAELPNESPFTLTVLDTNPGFSYPPFAGYEIPRLLDPLPWISLHTTEFRPDVPWGASLGARTTNQNLESMTFPDNSFDVLITSDIMEHVRLPARAHSEIARVIRPRGVYLFTVPHSRGLSENLVRVMVHDDDRPDLDEHVLPDEFHGTAQPGESPVLSYRVFGTNLDADLDAEGFDVDYSIAPRWVNAIFETELFYCRRR